MQLTIKRMKLEPGYFSNEFDKHSLGEKAKPQLNAC